MNFATFRISARFAYCGKKSSCINNIGGVWSYLPLQGVDHFGCIASVVLERTGPERSQKSRKQPDPRKGNDMMDRILAPGPFLRAIIEAFRVSYLKQGQ